MKIGIIGSGIAGMAVAIRLAVEGHQVQVFEANNAAGGKIYQYSENGYRFDIGPSLFTLPELLEELFKLADKKTEDYIEFYKLDTICKYFFNDKSTITAYSNKNKLYNEIEKIGIKSNVLKKYLKHNEFLFNKVSGLFLEKPLNKLSTFLNYDTLKIFLHIFKFNIFKSVNKVNKKYLKNHKLIKIFDRYVTYNGSNPYKASGILTLISHLENNLGTYMVKNGMYNINLAMYKLATDLGIKFSFNTYVSEIEIKKRIATGIKVNGQIKQFDFLISNADIYNSYKIMIPKKYHPKIYLKQPLSSSAIVFYWGIKKQFHNLDLHNVFFSDNFQEEFDSIFNNQDIYIDPTIYIYISSKHNTNDAPIKSENWYVSINTPYNNGQDWNIKIQNIRKIIIKKINRILNTDIEQFIELEKIDDPRTIEKSTNTHSGALYGPNSNSKFSAFLRHPNSIRRIKNLYFCGGTVHPGGGIPLCLLSAKIVANLIKQNQ